MAGDETAPHGRNGVPPKGAAEPVNQASAGTGTPNPKHLSMTDRELAADLSQLGNTPQYYRDLASKAAAARHMLFVEAKRRGWTWSRIGACYGATGDKAMRSWIKRRE